MTDRPLRRLFRNVAIYGAGDVAITAASFLLIPIYTRYLTPADYGVFALLLPVEAAAKILLRWGVDSAFMRLYYDCEDKDAQRTLASTIWIFLAAVNVPVLVTAFLLSSWLSDVMFGTPVHATTLRVFFVNTFLIGFFFIPFHRYRIEERSAHFAILTFLRAAGTTVMRLVLVVWWQMGVLGLVVADVILTGIVGICLMPVIADLLRPRFSRELLGQALGFGLPRVPHSMAHQITALSDRWVLNAFLSQDRVGVYSIGASFGLSMKLFLSAFEYAWAPFYLDAMKRPEAKHVYSRITTVVAAILVLFAATLSSVSADLVRLMTQPAFYDAAPIVPWIALGVVLQGFYQLTAIGLGITKRTTLLPVATTAAAAVAVTASIWFVPRAGMIGAAWSTALAYGTLATTGLILSQRVYPIRYDWRRLAVLPIAGLAAFGLATWLPLESLALVARVIVRGVVAAGVCGITLMLTGVVRPSEIRTLFQARRELPDSVPPAPAGEEVELAGEIGGVPSVVDAAQASRDAAR